MSRPIDSRIVSLNTFTITVLDVVEDVITGFDDEMLPEFNIYPNPASHFVRIEGHGADEVPSSVKVLTLNGVKVRETVNKGAVELDVRTLNYGLYIIRIDHGNKFTTTRLLIE